MWKKVRWNLNCIIFKHIYPLSQSSFKQMENILKYLNWEEWTLFVHADKKINQNMWSFRDTAGVFAQSGWRRNYLAFYKQHDVISPHIIRTKRTMYRFWNFQALTNLNSFNSTEKISFLMISNLEIVILEIPFQNELFRKTEKEIALASHTAKERLIRFSWRICHVGKPDSSSNHRFISRNH